MCGQIAITRFFDGEPTTDPLAEARAAQPQDTRRQENLMHSLGSSSSRRAIPNLEPAPRIVPRPENQLTLGTGNSILRIPSPVNLNPPLLKAAFAKPSPKDIIHTS